MTATEVELLVEAVYWKSKWEDSNPEVGFGPFIEDMIQEVCKDLHIYIAPAEIKHVMNQVYQKRDQ